jgi:hypothetical protein
VKAKGKSKKAKGEGKKILTGRRPISDFLQRSFPFYFLLFPFAVCERT